MKRTDCHKETEGKGQVATNDDEDDDDHVVSRDICMSSSKCSRYFLLLLFFGFATILIFLHSSKSIHIHIYIDIYIYIRVDPIDHFLHPIIILFLLSTSLSSSSSSSFFFSLHAIFAVVLYSVKSLRNPECTYTRARIIDIIDKKKGELCNSIRFAVYYQKKESFSISKVCITINCPFVFIIVNLYNYISRFLFYCFFLSF